MMKFVTPTCTYDIELDPTMSVAEMKESVEAYTDISPSEQHILFRGKLLGDNSAILGSLLLHPSEKFYLSRHKHKTEGAIIPPANVFRHTQDPHGPLGSLPPEVTESMVESLASNPDFVLSMMQQNPQTREMLKNPDIARELRDPVTLRDILRASLDPTARAGIHRSMELRMAQMSNMGGDSMLQAAFSGMLGNDHGDEEPDPRATTATEANAQPIAGQGANNRALPNPWASPTARGVAQLREMGFRDHDETLLRQTLEMSGGNVQGAANLLRMMFPYPQPPQPPPRQ